MTTTLINALLTIWLASCLVGGINANAQRGVDKESTPKLSTNVATTQRLPGYLKDAEPDFHSILPPYPVLSSNEDVQDVASLRRWQQPVSSERWKLANSDVRMSYDQFGTALGMPINAAESPRLIALLDRVEQDVQSVAFAAKDYYNRPRPFQRFQMEHVCGAKKAPAPERPLNGGSSYPSGHTSFGWAVALILAEVAPERAQLVLARGREYGDSRIVCAVHYPSDVVAGQLVATIVVDRLHSHPEFERDLSCVKQERAVALKKADHVNEECRTNKP